jgi:hypothetical protein
MGLKPLAGSRMLCRAYAVLRDLRGGFYDLERVVDAAMGARRFSDPMRISGKPGAGVSADHAG